MIYPPKYLVTVIAWMVIALYLGTVAVMVVGAVVWLRG